MTNYDSEHQLQKAVVNYIKLRWPAVRYCASLGGQYQKSLFQRKRAKETGYVAGFPDLQICEARAGYFGLFIELKLNKRCYPSKPQLDWIHDLETRGYKAEVCKGFDSCINLLEEYFSLKKTKSLNTLINETT